jgi:hypothetical protein
VLRTSCLHGALHIIKSRRLKNRKQFLFFLTPLAVSTFFYKVSVGGTAYITFGFEAKKAKQLAFSIKSPTLVLRTTALVSTLKKPSSWLFLNGSHIKANTMA